MYVGEAQGMFGCPAIGFFSFCELKQNVGRGNFDLWFLEARGFYVYNLLLIPLCLAPYRVDLVGNEYRGGVTNLDRTSPIILSKEAKVEGDSIRMIRPTLIYINQSSSSSASSFTTLKNRSS